MTNNALTTVFGKQVCWTEVLPIRPQYTRVHFDQERYLSDCEDVLTTELQIKCNKLKDQSCTQEYTTKLALE